MIPMPGVLTHVCSSSAPVQHDEVIYSASVSIFRAPESQGHVFLSDPYKAAFIACLGVYRPQIDSSGRLAPKHVQQLEQKLDLILKLAACFEHDSVVLGPMGCGGEIACAWYQGNRHAASNLFCVFTAQVAEVFARVLQRDAWGLQQVVVACLDTSNLGMEKSPYLTSKSNFQYFSEALFPNTTVPAKAEFSEGQKQHHPGNQPNRRELMTRSLFSACKSRIRERES